MANMHVTLPRDWLNGTPADTLRTRTWCAYTCVDAYPQVSVSCIPDTLEPMYQSLDYTGEIAHQRCARLSILDRERSRQKRQRNARSRRPLAFLTNQQVGPFTSVHHLPRHRSLVASRTAASSYLRTHSRAFFSPKYSLVHVKRCAPCSHPRPSQFPLILHPTESTQSLRRFRPLTNSLLLRGFRIRALS